MIILNQICFLQNTYDYSSLTPISITKIQPLYRYKLQVRAVAWNMNCSEEVASQLSSLVVEGA